MKRISANDPYGFVHHSEEDRLVGNPADRRHRRVAVRLPVRFILPDGVDRRGIVTDLSIRGAAIISEPGAIVGDAVILHIADLGRWAGQVAGLQERGFGVRLAASKEERLFLADALTAFLNPESTFDRAVRFSHESETILETESGTHAFGRLLDVSESGASIATALFPDCGEKIRVGRKRGTVIRHHPGGISVTFKRPEVESE
ncbi:MAG: PilZ domain-containing protein [Pseudomonadota bacterium]